MAYPRAGDDAWIRGTSLQERARQDLEDNEEIAPKKRGRAQIEKTESTRTEPLASKAAASSIGLFLASASRSRRVQIGAAALSLVILIIVVATRTKSTSPAATTPPIANHQPPGAATETPTAPVEARHDAPAIGEPAAAPTATNSPPAVAVATETSAQKPPRKLAFGGKPVVLEYDHPKQDVAAPAAPKSEDSALVKARAVYATGNQRLFAGDADGAIHAYQQALALYPGYVAGYRGLGLAYAQQGNNAKALQALRTYVSSVPNARDVALIKKRIARLQTP